MHHHPESAALDPYSSKNPKLTWPPVESSKIWKHSLYSKVSVLPVCQEYLLTAATNFCGSYVTNSSGFLTSWTTGFGYKFLHAFEQKDPSYSCGSNYYKN